MAFDLIGARNDGYTDQEIADFLSASDSTFDVKGAMGDGYSVDEIVGHINSQKLPEVTKSYQPASSTPSPAVIRSADVSVHPVTLTGDQPYQSGAIEETARPQFSFEPQEIPKYTPEESKKFISPAEDNSDQTPPLMGTFPAPAGGPDVLGAEAVRGVSQFVSRQKGNIGGEAVRAGQRMQQTPAAGDSEQISRGKLIAENLGITPEEIKKSRYGKALGSGFIKKYRSKLKSQQEIEDLTAYGISAAEDVAKEQGKKIEEFGAKKVKESLEEYPPWFEEAKFQDKIEAISRADPSAARSLRRGDLGGMIDIMVADAAVSGDPDFIQRARNVKKQFAQEYEKQDTEEKKIGVLQYYGSKTIEMLSMMGRSMAMDAPTMLVPGAGAGKIAKAAVGAIASAASLGMWAKQGAGDMYSTMVDEGVPHDIALTSALGASIVYAYIEKAQIGQFQNAAVKEALGKSFSKYLVTQAKEKGVDWVKESLEEAEQQWVTSGAVVNAFKSAGMGDKAAAASAQQFSDGVDSFIAGGIAMAPLNLIGFGKGMIGYRGGAGQDKPPAAPPDQGQPSPTQGQPQPVVPGAAPSTAPVPAQPITDVPSAQTVRAPAPEVVSSPALSQGKSLESLGMTADEFVAMPQPVQNEIMPKLDQSSIDQINQKEAQRAQEARSKTQDGSAEKGNVEGAPGGVRVRGTAQDRVGAQPREEIKPPIQAAKPEEVPGAVQGKEEAQTVIEEAPAQPKQEPSQNDARGQGVAKQLGNVEYRGVQQVVSEEGNVEDQLMFQTLTDQGKQGTSFTVALNSTPGQVAKARLAAIKRTTPGAQVETTDGTTRTEPQTQAAPADQAPVIGPAEFAKLAPEQQVQEYAKIHKVAMTDPLTDLSNRRGLTEQTRAAGKPLGEHDAIILDIDDFKKVNTKYGHPVGDEVIATLARIINDEFKGEAVGRWGGEEFAILPLTNKPINDILDKVEDARAKFSAMAFAGGKLTGMTFSAGHGVKSGEKNSIAVADDALYEAKNAGKAQTFTKGKRYVRTQGAQRAVRSDTGVRGGGQAQGGVARDIFAGQPVVQPTPGPRAPETVRAEPSAKNQEDIVRAYEGEARTLHDERERITFATTLRNTVIKDAARYVYETQGREAAGSWELKTKKPDWEVQSDPVLKSEKFQRYFVRIAEAWNIADRSGDVDVSPPAAFDKSPAGWSGNDVVPILQEGLPAQKYREWEADWKRRFKKNEEMVGEAYGEMEKDIDAANSFYDENGEPRFQRQVEQSDLFAAPKPLSQNESVVKQRRVTPKSLVGAKNREDIQAQTEQLFGGITEDRYAELDDGAEFKDQQEQAYYELANDYKADIEHAANNRDIKEVRALVEKLGSKFKVLSRPGRKTGGTPAGIRPKRSLYGSRSARGVVSESGAELEMAQEEARFQKEGQNEPTTVRQQRDAQVPAPAQRTLQAQGRATGDAQHPNMPAVVALQRAVEKAVGETIPANGFAAVDRPAGEEHQAAQGLADELGVEIVWFKQSPDARAVINLGGVQLSNEPTTIYANETTKKPVVVTVVHETMHIMQTQYPDLYREVRRAMVEEGTQGFRQKRDEMVAAGYSTIESMSESVAEISGEMFTDPGFLRRLAQRSPDAFRQFVDTMLEVISKAKAWLKGQKIEHAGKYFRDLNRVETALQKAIIEMKKRATGERRMAAQRQEAVFSLDGKRKVVQLRDVHNFERGQYLDENGSVIASSRETPQGPYPYPEGTWRVDDWEGSYGRPVEQLRKVKVADLFLSEDDYTKVNYGGRGDDANRYAGWKKEGKEFPPIDVLELDDGSLKVSNGHRRTAAAKIAGEKEILAWVSPRMDTGKKDTRGKIIYTAMTDRELEKTPMFQKQRQGAAFQKSAPTEEGLQTNLFPTAGLPMFENTQTGEEHKVVPEERVEVVKTETAPTAPIKQAPPGELQDFGQKIGGARKDYYSDYQDRFERAKEVDIAAEPLSRSWPEPDYDKLLEAGRDPWIVAFVRAARDEVPTKPSAPHKVRRWVDNVSTLRDVSEKLLSGDISKEALRSKLYGDGSYQRLSDAVGGRADLYAELGHGKSLKGISFAKHNYSFYKGEKNVTKWVVEKYQKSSAWHRGPEELAIGNTREEALEDFKQKYGGITTGREGKGTVSFVVYKRRDTGKYYIAKKMGAHRYLELKEFADSKEALAHLRANQAELEAQLERLKEVPSERREFNRERVGKDHRWGRDVDAEMFQDSFGFRGVEFGNWVNSKERQDNLNRAYDSLHDLATVLGVPAKAISLNGELGLGFGSRGHGGKTPASAHYEPDRVVINLTKKNGPGSLAHEWWHAFDNYVSRSRGKKLDYMTENARAFVQNDATRPELKDAFNAVMLALGKTKLKERSEELDTTRTKDYWSQNIEMTARTFENYVIDKLADMGANNDYLANVASSPEYARALADRLLSGQDLARKDMYPYLTPDELAIVKPALDNLFATIKTMETPTGVAMFQKQNSDPFYSPTLRAVEALKQERGTGDQFFAQIVKTPGVKEAEWKWMGLDDFLKGKQSVTKVEVAEFVRQNQVKVEEVEKGKGHFKSPLSEAESNRLEELSQATDLSIDEEKEYALLSKKVKNAKDVWVATDIPKTKYSQYKLPGGENYREVLLALPALEDRDAYLLFMSNMGKKYGGSSQGYDAVQSSGIATEQEKLEYIKLRDKKDLKYKESPPFKSFHWSEPNVIAHVRLNDRTGPNGEKVLFIEEIQSDWAREAREKGIAGKGDIEKWTAEKQDVLAGNRPTYHILDEQGRIRGEFVSNVVRDGETVRDMINRVAKEETSFPGAPPQPFLKNWEELTLKRVLRMAAEKDYDRVAWINGAQTADRYNLSKQVDDVQIRKNNDDTYDLRIQLKNESTISEDNEHQNLSLKQVEEMVGKDLAKKSSEQEVDEFINHTGDDLKIGGEWATSLYDRMIPKFLEKYGKKWGAKVDVVPLETKENFDMGMRYEGPDITKKDIVAKIPTLDSRLREQAAFVLKSIDRGENIKESMDRNASNALANVFGGKMIEVGTRATPQMSVAITPEMRKSVMTEGQPMFQRQGETKKRSFPQTLDLAGRPATTDENYEVKTNEQTVERAREIIKDRGVDGAEAWVLDEDKPSAEHTATAISLITKLQSEAQAAADKGEPGVVGKISRAINIATDISRKLTAMGQAVQAASIVSRLSPDGVVLYATKKIEYYNRQHPKNKPVQLEPEQAQNLIQLAQKTKRAEIFEDEARQISAIVERLRAGETLAADEKLRISGYAKSLSALLGEAPASEGKPTKERRDGLAKVLAQKLDTAEAAARLRFEARHKGTRFGAGLPLDDMADLSIIGAAKIGKLGLKYADWSGQMVADFGAGIKPHLKAIWNKSIDAFNIEKSRAKKIYRESRAIQSLIKKVESDPDIAGSQIAAELGAMVDKVQNLTGDAKIDAAHELQAALAGLEKPTVLRKIATAQTIAQLLNPKTILVRNPLGNEMFYRLERFNKTFVATPIDILASRMTGKRTITFKTANQGGFWKAWMTGARAGWNGWEPEGLTSQFDLKGSAFRGKLNPMTYLEKSLGAAIRSFDFAAYTRAKNQVIGEMAELAATNKGITVSARKAYVANFIRNVDEFTTEVAQQYGKYVTFQDENLLSKTASGIKKILNAHKDFGVGDLVLKYPRTPANLMMRALDYSPAGALRAMYLLAKPWMGKTAPGQREIVEALSRAITGAGIGVLGYLLMAAGVLSGTRERDPELRKFKEEQTGERNYQVNTSALARFGRSLMSGRPSLAVLETRTGDTMVSYDWAQPVSLMTATGANVARGVKTGAREGLVGGAYDAFSGGMETMMEQPMVQGLQQLFGNQYGKDKISGLAKILEGVPASFAPSIINQVRQAVDNTARETYDPTPVQRSVNKVIAKLPFVNRVLPRAYKTMGAEERETFQDGSNTLFGVFLNPGFVAKYKIDPMVEMLMQPYESEGRTGQFPKIAPRKLRVNKGWAKKLGLNDKGVEVEINLTGEQLQELQQSMAQKTEEYLSKIDTEKLKGYAPVYQEKMLAEMVGKAAEVARLEFLEKNKEVLADQVK